MIIGRGLYMKKYCIYSSELPSSFDGFRFVFISDLHGKEYGVDNEILMDIIDKAAPDCILIGGDMVVGGENTRYPEGYSDVSRESVDVSIKLIKKLSERYKIIHALGNHEEKLAESLRERYFRTLSELSVNLLDNSSFNILNSNGESIDVYGLSLGREYYPKLKRVSLPEEVIEDRLGVKSEKFSILMAHSPLYFKSYASWGAELTLSGHLHGGVMRIPYIGGAIGPDFLIFPRYSGGLYENGHKKMIVSCGAGMHTINLRIFNPPEITFVELKVGERKNGN